MQRRGGAHGHQAPRPRGAARDGGRGPGRGFGLARGGGRPAGGAGTGALGEGRAACRTETLEEVEDLAATNVVLQSKAWDAERRRAAAEDELEGHQMSRAEAGRGELEEELEEKDTRLEMDGRMIEQLEGEDGAEDDDGAERQKH